jgi:DNA segregation ATPase FtsK/SpoIIIE-like protein
MDEIYTVGVFGQKGSGKSNSINVMICTWIQRARPDELRLFLTDLKGALEFFNYNGIPHLGGDVDHKMKLSDDSPAEPVRLGLEVLSEPHQVAPVLEYMEKEMARRQKLMQGRARKISAYNRKVKKPLSRWILVIDELATLADSEHKKGCYKSLAELIRKGRAVGLYVVLATQIPDKTVLTRQIAGNLDFRVVGFLPDGASSALTLGDGSWDATRLNPEVHGRMIAKWNEKNIIQAPFINDLTIDRIIKAVKTGQATVDTEETAMADEIFTYALEDLGGLCSHRELYKHFKNRYSDHRIRNLLKQWEVRAVEDGKGLEPVITLADMEYYLLPATRDGNNGRIPRQLLSLPDFEKKRGEWIEIIASRTWQVAHGTKNSRGVDGQSSKVSKAVEANQAN